MKSTSLIVISVSLILFSFGCSKERELSELEYNLLLSQLRSLQNVYLNNLDREGNDLDHFAVARRIHDTIPNNLYVMIQNP